MWQADPFSVCLVAWRAKTARTSGKAETRRHVAGAPGRLLMTHPSSKADLDVTNAQLLHRKRVEPGLHELHHRTRTASFDELKHRMNIMVIEGKDVTTKVPCHVPAPLQ